jgi:hypothetical protein
MNSSSSAAGFFSNRQRHGLAGLQPAEQRPAGGIAAAAATAAAQRVDLRGVRLAGDDHDLGPPQQRRRQPRGAVGHHRITVLLEIEQSDAHRHRAGSSAPRPADAVGQPGPVTENVQGRQDGADVVDLLVVRPVREIDHEAAVRVAEGAQQLARRRRRVFAPEHGDARQSSSAL